MRTQKTLLARGILVLTLSLGLVAAVTSPVKAEICTWEGDTSTSWDANGNWSCGHFPGQSDDVIIPGGTTFNPEISTGQPSVKTLTIASGAHLTLSGRPLYLFGADLLIQSGGQLTVSGGGSITLFYPGGTDITIEGTLSVEPQLTITGTGAVINADTGTISLNGSDFNNTFIYSYVPLNNDGAIDIQYGILGLYKSGLHSGSFTGTATARLVIGKVDYPGQTHTFGPNASLKIPTVYFSCGTLNMNGEYFPPVTGSKLEIQNNCTTNKVIVDSTAPIVMPQLVNVMGYSPKIGELILEPYTDTMEMQNLDLSGTLTNNRDLTILDTFSWTGGKLAGSGTTESGALATLTFSTLNKTLDGHQLINTGITEWDSANLSLLNGAGIQNNGTFNANATTTMVGDAASYFVNNGGFYKKTDGTTTLMDVTFSHNGPVEVLAGTLVFTSEFIPGTGGINLSGGTLDVGDTLTVTKNGTLTGSGTLNSNLVNAGLVSPGESPGLITVNGDYTQEVSGSLRIELGGIVPGTLFDQLVVTGTATLAGELDVSLIEPYVPSAGDRYTITTYADHTGVFDAVKLPGLPSGTDWFLDYGSTCLTLDVVSVGISFTSPNVTTFTVGVMESFMVTASGNPTPTISFLHAQSDNLPSDVSFTPGNGTAMLSGLAESGYGGVYNLKFGATNGVTADVTQTFTLMVQEAPTITHTGSAAFEVGVSHSFTITTSSYPTPTISLSGSIPDGVEFTDNGDGTASVSGTPGVGTEGDYPIIITASNGVLPNASQPYTLTVNSGKYIYLPMVMR